MPLPTPFAERTHPLATSLAFKEWAGCLAPCRYSAYHEREYYALRHAATVMDATPLYKVDVTGPDAAELFSLVTVRNFERFSTGRVAYTTWCDPRGKVLDDGTVMRLEENRWRFTSADSSVGWLSKHARGLDVKLVDTSRTIAALSLQGPRSREVLRGVVGDIADGLRFFRAQRTEFAGQELLVTRTGYTGDLGYELWIANDGAVDLWDAIIEAGRPHGLLPMGLDALDVSRVEAGFLLAGVEYSSAKDAFIPRQESTPYELGFDWMVDLNKEYFVGRDALVAEQRRGVAKRLVGLVVNWERFEELCAGYGLPPGLETATCRLGVPVYRHGKQIGYATSRTWSPLLKQYLALAHVPTADATPGTELEIEVTLEYERRRCLAHVTPMPFFDPPRKKSTPDGAKAEVPSS